MTFLNKRLDNLIEKYNVAGPYYTSYPTLSEWKEKFYYEDYISSFSRLGNLGLPNFLYIHFPFCAKQCFYCICNSVISTKKEKIKEFLNYISKEIDLIVSFFEKYNINPNIDMIHIGGGTPNLMSIEDFNFLLTQIKKLVKIKDLKEFAVEIDIRTVSKEKIYYYGENYVNRLSLGIQDFNFDVQKSINRIQSISLIDKIFTKDIKEKFSSINYDILYGLPKQSRKSFKETINIINELSPDRITLLKYAHIPNKRKHQNFIKKEDLPDYLESENMFFEACETLKNNEYDYVGVNHFSKKKDSLFLSKQDKSMWRNFLGFSPYQKHNILGIGPTATSGFDNMYTQNVYDLKKYYSFLDKNILPLKNICILNQDDLIRREVINKILCEKKIDFKSIELKYDIKFEKYFKKEILDLEHLIKENFLEKNKIGFNITFLGEIFIRHICKIFDSYLNKKKEYKIVGP